MWFVWAILIWTGKIDLSLVTTAGVACIAMAIIMGHIGFTKHDD
ncbi:MAG: hypothetical protein ACFFD4_07735 [Candidatus Odinarchaeota archaeon]